MPGTALGQPHSVLRLMNGEGRAGWGSAPEGFDAATLYACALFPPHVAVPVRAGFPVLGSPAGLAVAATVCAMFLQIAARGDRLASPAGSGTGLA
ncbi:hypothetical protein ACFYWX_31840 [Streptomyces sp. NPDC002888]|uniref:hypothetical protein n=1 Tax=Streptomyces sp. NPDC002888 TaxID=3364668 RepID=UPI0036B29B68